MNGTATLLTSYTYDAAGRLASLTYPSGVDDRIYPRYHGPTTALTAQTPDGSGAVPILVNVNYRPFGPVNALTFGNGVAETRSFDLDYRMTSLVDAGMAPVQNLTYTYDAANSVSSITDGVTATNSQAFGYDALERLTSASGAYGSLAYTYDSMGNRLTQSTGAASTTYTYGARTNQLASVSANGSAQAVGYTKAGYINSFNSGGAGLNLTYNQAGRLATVAAAGSPIAQYTYDAFGQRLAKVGAITATTLYQYDSSGRLLEETDDQGSPLADYIYLDTLPVATISPVTGQVYFLHNDRLGAPQVATDSYQNVAWIAELRAFRRNERDPQRASCRICACPARSSTPTRGFITTGPGTTRRRGAGTSNPTRAAW